MANSIRTPKQGVTAGSRRIAQAVDDEDWQEFRVSLKGKSTERKLEMLQEYYNEKVLSVKWDSTEWDDVIIRIDNYIKALCRGGQLAPGMTFQHFSDGSIKKHIRR